MKRTTATKVRLSMTVRLYKGDIYEGESKLVDSATRVIKSRILDIVQGKPRSEWDYGYIRIVYNAKLNYFNHAYFKDFKQLQRIVSEFTEWDLVKDFI